MRTPWEVPPVPSSAYHRKQAELFASLALANTSEAYLMERYTVLAREHLAAAEVAEAAEAEHAGQMPPLHMLRRGSDMDRD